ETEQHYLERFFLRLPRPGMITVFDRSWYGRVLVERVERLCSAEASRRAFDEINAFEKMLQADGILILKYFLDLTHEEQGKRFSERERDPLKNWKLTEEDWRNRSKWKQYHVAYKTTLARTATRECPWVVIAADHKWYARVQVLLDIAERIKSR
ncbi:MAG: UDP-galactose-lipid carrier transferase, partial [Bdellovibrionota bacterium]